jgi:hypothetical protein
MSKHTSSVPRPDVQARRFPVADAEDTKVARPPDVGQLPLPHERDESADAEAPGSTGPREVIEQAARDIARGLKDTDRHGIPGDVPGPDASPERTPGAEGPADAPPSPSHGRA